MEFAVMPIYEYICKSCGYEFEKIRAFSDATMPTCPSCQLEDVQRKLGVPAIHFKGSGWYINDSKESDSKKKPSSGEQGGAESSENGSESKNGSESPSSADKSSESKSADKDTSTTNSAKGEAGKEGATKSTTDKSATKS